MPKRVKALQGPPEANYFGYMGSRTHATKVPGDNVHTSDGRLLSEIRPAATMNDLFRLLERIQAPDPEFKEEIRAIIERQPKISNEAW